MGKPPSTTGSSTLPHIWFPGRGFARTAYCRELLPTTDGGILAAHILLALLFGGLHLFNTGASAMTAISVTLLGAFWALVYVQFRDLWVVVARHAAWNVTIFVCGVPLSGQEAWRLHVPFESGYAGSVWLTGGGFGPEDSVLWRGSESVSRSLYCVPAPIRIGMRIPGILGYDGPTRLVFSWQGTEIAVRT